MGILRVALASFGLLVPLQGQDEAQEVRRILEMRCAACHGGGDRKPASDFDVTKHSSFEAEAEREFVALTIEDGDMPPTRHKTVFEKRYGVTAKGLEGMQLSAGERKTLVRWLQQGAPSWESGAKEREFRSYDDLVRIVFKDLRAMPAEARRHQRYLTLANLYNAGDADERLQLYRDGVRKLLHSLTWRPEALSIVNVEGTGGTLLRFDLRSMGTEEAPWTAETWDQIASYYPYFIPLRGLAVTKVAGMLGTKHYFLRADWFAYATTRPPLYHDLLGIPDTLAELEALLAVDVPGNIAAGEVLRGGTTDSGVSTNHRIIERHAIEGDRAYWLSYDFRAPDQAHPRRNILKFPLGPGDREDRFQHAGGEVIFHLPNGMQGYMLADETGRRLDVAPTDIVQNQLRVDAAVINGISCMECHAAGMRDINAHVRQYVDATVEQDGITFLEEFHRLYPGRSVVGQAIERDRDLFLRSLERALGRELEVNKGEVFDPIAVLVRRFEEKIDRINAAAEFNASERDLLQLFDNPLVRNDPRMIELRARLDYTKISRNDFVVEFSNLATRFLGADYLERHAGAPLPGLSGLEGTSEVSGKIAGSTLTFEDGEPVLMQGAFTIDESQPRRGLRCLSSGEVRARSEKRASLLTEESTGRIRFAYLIQQKDGGALEVRVNDERVLRLVKPIGQWAEAEFFLLSGSRNRVEFIARGDTSTNASSTKVFLDDVQRIRARRVPRGKIDFEADTIPQPVRGDWTIDSSRALSGRYAINTGVTAWDGVKELALSVPRGTRQVAFSYRMSSGHDDTLVVNVHGKQRMKLGDTKQTWKRITLDVDSDAAHQVRLRYEKNDGGEGEDRVWVDAIEFLAEDSDPDEVPGK